MSILQKITERLTEKFSHAQAHELARWIVEEISGKSYYLLASWLPNATQEQQIAHAIECLLQDEPIQYIFGHTLWAGLDIFVTRDTLIPRPETSQLISIVLKHFSTQKEWRILDVGTGSGCIAIALKKHFSNSHITAIDTSEKALQIARKNALHNGTDVTFERCDIFSQDAKKMPFFDFVVSNPPYICEREKTTMERNVLNFEPHEALFVPNEQSLIFYQKMIELNFSNNYFFEANPLYINELKNFLESKKFATQCLHDDAGKARFIVAKK